MAIDARQAAHALAVHLFAFVALGAELFRGKEMVKTALIGLYLAVTLGAFDLFHVNMLGMEKRLIDVLCLALGMTLIAAFLAYDDLTFVPLGDLGRPVEHKADEQLVLLGNRQVMAVVAIQRLVFALRPAVVSRLHEMAPYAEFRIVLGKIIKLVCNKTAAADDNEKQDSNEQLCFQRQRFFETIDYLIYFVLNPINNSHTSPIHIQSIQ
jgi:hypothetical protein